MTAASLPDDLAGIAARVEAELAMLLESPGGPYERLAEAMRYSALGGGKRLRAYLVAASARLFEVAPAAAIRVGAAVELVHAYSLIHDDLPAMDDAQTRRGKPANHKAFDEATAILAGDALQALAFDALARSDWPASSACRLRLVGELAQAAGLHGMCGGQMVDLLAETQGLDLAQITRLQALKTGALFAFSCRAGALLATADDAALRALSEFAAVLGLAFQIKDDLLDLTGDAATVGKDIGRDADRGKATFPSLLGVAGAEARLAALRDDGHASLARWGDDAARLRDVLDFVIKRQS